MAGLRQGEQMIINELLDHSVFSSAVTPQTTETRIKAIQTLKKPLTQRRIQNYLADLLGVQPVGYQENLVFFIGARTMPAAEVHVLLATLKAVINLPELQQQRDDRAVLTKSIIRQVHSEVVELDEKQIRHTIVALFVDRFGIFAPVTVDVGPSEQAEEIDDYWEVDPKFNAVAQSLVDWLSRPAKQPAISARAAVNQALLTQGYLSRREQPHLWQDLQANREKIAAQWAQLDRFALECGEDYALLLDTRRQPSVARPFMVAIVVAHSLGFGIEPADLHSRIKQTWQRFFPGTAVDLTGVKAALHDNALIKVQPSLISPSPLVARFALDDEQAAAQEVKS